jgi:hypothetical protein
MEVVNAKCDHATRIMSSAENKNVCDHSTKCARSRNERPNELKDTANMNGGPPLSISSSSSCKLTVL